MIPRTLQTTVIYILISALFVTCCLFTGCASVNYVPEPPSDLVFIPTHIDLLDAYSIYENRSVTPFYDPDSGTITIAAEHYDTTEENRSSGTVHSVLHLITFDPKNSITDDRTFPLPEGVHLGPGVISESACIFFSSMKGGPYLVMRYDRDGVSSAQFDLSDYILDEEAQFRFFCQDADGRICLSEGKTVFVFDETLNLLQVFELSHPVADMVRGSDGKIWMIWENGASVFSTDNGTLGDPLRFVRDSDSIGNTKRTLLNTPSNSSAYNFFCYDDDNVYGVAVHGDVLEETVLMNFISANIGVVRHDDAVNYAAPQNGVYPCSVIVSDPAGDHDLPLIPVLRYDGQAAWDYEVWKEENVEIDPDNHTVTLAYTYALTPDTVSKITGYNRAHPEMQIVPVDYAKYVKKDDPSAGEHQLLFDILNAGFRPDIIVTSADTHAVSDDMAAIYLLKHDLLVDLDPYLREDRTVNYDTLFGCIPRLFADGNGGVWGIAPDMNFAVLTAAPEALGKYAAYDSWSVDDMLDFFDSLPDETEKVYFFINTLPSWTVLGRGYGEFIGGEAASFDSPTFIRYLSFLNSVPSEWSERTRIVPYIGAGEPLVNAQHDGRLGVVRFESEGFSVYPELSELFSGNEKLIGLASGSGRGTQITADHVFSITNYAKDPSLCFDIVTMFFDFDDLSPGDWAYWPLSSLKPVFEAEMELYTSSWQKAQPLTKEELAAYYRFLDAAGSPLIEETPEDIDGIVVEEVSKYLSGTGTAEDCAAKIQSRVSIWLAEHQ